MFCGLRISEALGLRWSDIDFERGTINVHSQLDDRTGQRVEPKTANAIRSVVMMPTLGKMLREHRLRSRYSGESDPVFASTVGTPLNRHNVAARIFRPAVKRAGLIQEGKPRLRLHDLRHTWASLLIAGGASVVFVSRQLGHASPAMTLSTYAALFDGRDHAEALATMLEAEFGETITGGASRV